MIKSMDRKMLEDHLRQALGHVALGRKHIARQREIISELELGGRDTTVARQVLATFEDLQFSHESDLDRIETELAKTGRQGKPE
jgi:hypothetical protein